MLASPLRLSREEAASYLVGQLGLRRVGRQTGARGVRALLRELRCIQLDPLDPIGTNADLVALARVDGIARGDVYRHLLPGHAFEHFAKERCLLPASAFPAYRDQAAQAPWWRLSERLKRVPEKTLASVLEELDAAGGARTADELADHGSVEPLDWDGWKGTGKATRMALEILWTRCQVVVSGRGPGGKRYDLPARALPLVAHAPAPEFARWALLERVEAAGLLARASGPTWSMLSEARRSPLPELLVSEGKLVEVTVEGTPGRFLAPAGFQRRRFPADDGRLRILAPLDPLLWNRRLVSGAFGFDYVWEVYKPAAQRRFGWYVHPLLHRGKLVGRLEGRLRDGALVIERLWREPALRRLPEAELEEALARHAGACGVERVKRPRRVEVA